MSTDLFPRGASAGEARRFVSVLAKRPSKARRFPVTHPRGAEWQVKVVGTSGRFALSLWRRVGRTLVYPNEVVERELATRATTRNWDTMSKIHNRLREA